MAVIAWVAAGRPVWAQVGDIAFGDLGGTFGQGPQGPVVTVTGEFTPPDSERRSRLFVTATMASGWHIYSITQAAGGPIRSEIRLENDGVFRVLESFQAVPPPDKKVEPLFDNLVVESHHDTVVWHAAIELAPETDAATLRIAGALHAQACKEVCIPPQEYEFTAALGPGVDLPTPAESTASTPPKSPAASTQGPTGPESPRGTHGLPWVRVTTFAQLNEIVQNRILLDKLEENEKKLLAGEQQQGLAWPLTLILLGFAGGILLNVMPCVLPVIGLKILSFVDQAGENRVRALMLNVAFSAGLISVFLILAGLAAGLGLQWGGQFQYPWFNVTMAVVIFAMGLSFLGVWEIPIPGFVGTGKAADLAQREGLAAAFTKGIITTLLATPCTGPGMGFAVTMVMSEPPELVFAVFAAVGLGMASPYLLIGVFPRLISFLPKPGPWMDTFKQTMGFVLLATTVWIFSFIHWPYVVPTIGTMFGVWAACWWVQRTPATAELGKRVMAWLEAMVFAGLVWALMFPGVYPFSSVHRVMSERWQWETAGAEQATVRPGRYTLMVDFTANWCVNCKWVEANVLDTDEVRELVERNGVVPVQFDMTEAPEDDQTKRFVQIVRAAQPSLTILPADDPNRPRTPTRQGLYGQATALEDLAKAGPSIDKPQFGATP
jgi:thiol:disulfide interchange protein DsbD